MVRSCWLAAIWLIGIEAHAQDWSGHVRLQLGQEYDSNAVRENRPDAPGDFLTRLVAQGRLNYTLDEYRLWLDFQAGGKLFYHRFDEHQVASRAEGGVRWRLPNDRSAGVR